MLSHDQQGDKRGCDVKSRREEQEATDLDNTCHMTEINNKIQTEAFIESCNTKYDDAGVTFGNQTNVIDEKGDVIDSGVFERTYFDETLEKDDVEYDNNEVEDFYGSKLSLLSSNDEEVDSIMR